MAVLDQFIQEECALYHGDCIEVMADLPDSSVGLSVFSPPFADLYCYSDDPRDLGNCESYDEFFRHFRLVAEHLCRVVMPGRIVAIHCMDIPAMKQKDGYIGIKDFSGDIVRMMQGLGCIYHSRHVIWKDPLIEATRTKALGLMHKQLCKDSSMSRAGIPDTLLAFRVPGQNEVPITHDDGLASYAGSEDPGGDGVKRSHNIWRAYASPVWMDVRQTRTLNGREARDPEDEKHICPLQLDVIERTVQLWSNPGEVVLTPFMGVGSEVYVAVTSDRRGVGVELKDTYYRQAVENVSRALAETERQGVLFA